MAWDDRSFSSRDNYRSWGSGIFAALNGSLPLYEAMGIAVRAHILLLAFVGGELFINWRSDFPLRERSLAVGLLLAIVLLHEYGHCFMARWTGGLADRIVLWPLGGLAYTDAPHRPLARFLTAAAGPAVNLLICLSAGAGVYVLTSMHPTADAAHVIVSFNPFDMYPPDGFPATARVFYWTFEISYVVLLFNLLPIFPFDGGQMVQAALWPKLGHARSMSVATMTGMIAAVALMLVGVVEESHPLLLALLAIIGFMTCYNMRDEMRESAEDEMYGDPFDFGEHVHAPPRPRKRLSPRAINRARKIAAKEKAERDLIDGILSKVSLLGMPGLTWRERRALHKATDRQRKREVELSELGMD